MNSKANSNNMELVRNFKQLGRNDAHLAGGKGASLGEMTGAGIPVPPGFVVLAESFEQFIRETDLIQEIDSILDKVNHNEIHTVESASEKIKDLILSREMPKDIAKEIEKHFKELDTKYVAVRSSATAEDGAEHAWAGQLDSYLNVTENDVLLKVRHCWASLFTPRAIFYRFEKGLHTTKISVAVVVQKMVNSEVSGIAFSVHPVTEDYNQLIIEAGFGLGEAIVSGSVTPDSYVVEKNPQRIIDINVSSQERALYRLPEGGNEWRKIDEPHASSQVLNESQILELSEIILHIENHYGFPCDIEWAYEAGKFYIVQSRPITTLSKKPSSQPKQVFVKAYTRNFSIIMQQAWFAANKENLVSKLGLTEYPYNPPYLYYMRDGVEEVWENTKANRWLLDKVIEKFKSDTQFFPEVYKRYYDQLSEIEKWWKKDIKTIPELEKFIDKVYAGVSDFVILYSSLMDKEVPKEYQELANKFREKDVFFAECNTAIWKALNNIYPDLGYLAVYITREELGKDIDKEELKKRDAGFALIPGIFVGPVGFDELTNKFPEFKFEIEKGEQDENGLRGQSAYKGKVTGRVRIVKRRDQVDQLLDGEIIVSPMTTPDMVSAMKRAAAFVTDEGGITCHAAIIAREMQKPCVIGTKTATQILKDGDEIEVNADDGIVKILSSKSDELPQVPLLEKFDFTFESQGTSFIFEDLVGEFYVPGESVSLCRNDLKSVYISKETIHGMNEEGRKMSTKELTAIVSSLETTIAEAVKETLEFSKKKDFSKEDAIHMFNVLAKICREYLYFDYSYWDDTFKLAENDKEARKKVDLVQNNKNKLRADLDPVFFGNGYLPVLIDKVSKHSKVSKEDLAWYRYIDVIELLNGKRVPEEEINARKQEYVYYKDQNSKIHFYSGDGAHKFIDQFLGKEKISISEDKIIRGKKAHSTGKKVKGKVRILARDYGNPKVVQEAMELMEIGEILVSQTTDPELMPALRKASAVVTDIGGMLSHSAITARELNIPCVVDTKNASKLLKTGDEIEVDADMGIIKVLSMSSPFETTELQYIKPDEWHFYGLWKQDVFSACFWQSCFDQKILHEFGFDVKSGSTMIANGGHFFYHKPTIENIKKHVENEISKNNTAPFKKFADESKSTYLAGIDFAQKTIKTAPLNVEYFDEFLSHGRTMSLYWWFSAVHLAVTVESLLQDKIVEHKIPAQDVPHLIPKVVTPLLEQQKELVHLKEKIGAKSIEDIKADKNLFVELEAHRKKYAWIEIANWIGEELTFDRLINQIEHAKENFEEPIVNIPIDVKKVAECLGYVGYAKQAGAEYVAMYEYLVMPYLHKLAKHLGLTYREMMTITHEEIRSVLAGKKNALKKISASESRKKMRWVIASKSNGDMCIVENTKDTELIEKLMVPQAEKGTREIKGEIGNRGKAVGTVRVIMNVDDFHKMQPKDVLVTTMTTPDFVILMQKASAIITDIGGMLCHAAIVSREINRPCIIGTRFATQLLKDGDRVEVDADKGIINIL
jgi:phosphoenolpyruvate synthase/pyruvate phosphate dikinase